MRRWAFPLFAIGMLLLPALPVPDFWITQSIYIGMAALVALGLVLLTGVCGLTSFGQAAFVGVGAYTTAWLSTTSGLSPWWCLLLGVVLAVLGALLVGSITLRMSGHYLPLATIAWGLALNYSMANMAALGKYDGLLGIPGLQLFGVELGSGRGLHDVVWLIALLAAAACTRLLDSRAGRAMRALKSGTTMTEAMGISTLRYKLLVFVLAAVLAAISGWLFAHFQRSVNPTPFALGKGIEYLFMAVIGGVGHVWGAFLGAAVVRLTDDQLQVLLPKLLGTSGNFETIVFGIVLVMMLKLAPQGLWSFVQRRWPTPPRVRDWAAAAPLPSRNGSNSAGPVLQVAHLRKEFGGLVAVNDVSFDVQQGDIVGLIGPNGAGKSTTFNLVTGVLSASAGKVLLQGQNISGMGARQIAQRGVSRTFQHVKLVPEMTVLENVALGGHLRSCSSAWQAVLGLDRNEEKQLFAEAERQLTRVGLGAQLHELAGNLALGPQRLVEIARALCTDPVLLLLDEPAAGLRHKEKQALAAVLRELKAQGMSLLLVEHDMDFVMGLTDRIVVMEFGTRLMEGTPAQVQASPAVRAAYLGVAH
jgi:branched-chain amino acid transport system permease protein